MAKVNFNFATDSEAEAFKQGVECVNDSAFTVLDIQYDQDDKTGKSWVVVCEDEDL